MALLDIALAYYRFMRALTRRTQDATRRLWREVELADLDGSWGPLADRMLVTVAAAQFLAAQRAAPYLDAALAAQGASADALGRLVPASLAGVASDGRSLDTLLYEPVIRVKTAIGSGEAPSRALASGEASLVRIAGTQVQDTGRAAVAVGMVTRPSVTSWVRVLNPPSCGRCAVLAGRRYRSEAIGNFNRHENCDCTAAPLAEDTQDALRTDPDAYFRSLTREDQDKYFTVAGAQAIRDGADIGQVVNARRGARGLSQPGRLTDAEQRTLRGGRDRGRLERVDVFGRQVLTTTEGTTVRAVAGKRLAKSSGTTKAGGQRYRRAKTPRLMPDAILELAGDDREERVRLLKRFGYIL
jgi:hypothetical protein